MKRLLSVLLLASLAVAPMFAQKFTKREQARREAREANYFYGASFTFTGGYELSYMTNEPVRFASSPYGKSECWGNDHKSFNAGFLWDQAINRRWGIQTGLYYAQKGGEHLYFYEGLYGPIARPEETETVSIHCIELQSQGRLFLPVTKRSRFSLNAGFFVDLFVDTPGDIKKWNFGPQGGIGFDYDHLSVSATYQFGIPTRIADDCSSRLNGFSFNIGYRFWKK